MHLASSDWPKTITMETQVFFLQIDPSPGGRKTYTHSHTLTHSRTLPKEEYQIDAVALQWNSSNPGTISDASKILIFSL